MIYEDVLVKELETLQGLVQDINFLPPNVNVPAIATSEKKKNISIPLVFWKSFATVAKSTNMMTNR